MRKSDAVSFFGNQTKYAAALNRAASTISEYDDVLPLEAALLTEKIARGRLKVDFRLYDPRKLPPALRPR